MHMLTPFSLQTTAASSCPLPTDSPDLFLDKLGTFVDTVTSDRSIAVATGFAATVTQGQDVARAAQAQMRPLERSSWDACLRGSIRLPDIDSNVDKGDKPTGKKSYKIARQRSEALNRLYETDRARPEHSVWFIKNHPRVLSLVKAMARVIGMERHMGIHRGSRVESLDLADLQTTRSIISTSLKIKRNYETAFKGYKRAINSGIQTLIGHKKKIQEKRRKMIATPV